MQQIHVGDGARLSCGGAQRCWRQRGRSPQPPKGTSACAPGRSPRPGRPAGRSTCSRPASRRRPRTAPVRKIIVGTLGRMQPSCQQIIDAAYGKGEGVDARLQHAGLLTVQPLTLRLRKKTQREWLHLLVVPNRREDDPFLPRAVGQEQTLGLRPGHRRVPVAAPSAGSSADACKRLRVASLSWLLPRRGRHPWQTVGEHGGRTRRAHLELSGQRRPHGLLWKWCR